MRVEGRETHYQDGGPPDREMSLLGKENAETALRPLAFSKDALSPENTLLSESASPGTAAFPGAASPRNVPLPGAASSQEVPFLEGPPYAGSVPYPREGA
ncbi:hypothetical protein ACFYY8_38265 [Streptosporangium sp. NPDC001559]|uniref:hypothetical protein n=1 Tax=Streptosporangium sp. NPDC001559 TaxID=3366187 RepID=UPI0036E636AE